MSRSPTAPEPGHGEDVQDPAARAASESNRLDAAHRLMVPASGSALAQLCDRARRLLRCANAQISLLLDEHTVVAIGGATSAPPVGELLALLTAGSDVLAIEDARVDERSRETAAASSGAVGAFLAVPLRGTDGVLVGALSAHDRRSRRWSGAEITLLQELAASTLAELELSALSADYDTSRLRWDLAIDAARVGTFDWDLVNDRVDWDERLQELYGYAPGEFVPHIDTALSRTHPHDRESLQAAIQAAIETCGDYRAEFRVKLPGGQVRWMSARGRALGDPEGRAVRLLGVAYDVTEIRNARDSAAHVLASMAMGFFFVDRSWSIVYLNAEAERILGRPAGALIGRNLWSEFPGAEELDFGQQYHRAMESGEAVSFEFHDPRLDAWYEVRAAPDTDGLGVYFLDITERRRAQEEAERSTARLDLLGTISGELAATLEAEEAVSRLARLVVPALADWCLVTLVGDEGLADIGSWHVDPERRPDVAEYSRTRLGSLQEGSLLDSALESGRPVVVSADATALVSERLGPGRARDLLHSLAPESGAVFPLRGRDRTVGLLTLFRGADRTPMPTADLTTAQSVAFRAGLALDNARLYRQQRDLAAGLQRNMLTDPPDLADVEIVVRYQPAARAAAVGGDWYDSFVQSTGETVFVIGDVVGHDVEAAAAMGQLRGLLRGIAFHAGCGPADVLTGLDSAMEGLAVNTTATAVVARIEHPEPDQVAGTTRLRWSNAGHPPPLVIRPDGHTELLTYPEPDLLLGLDPDTERQEYEALLEPGSTVLFYTDGLTERRAHSLEIGLAGLREELAQLHGLLLDQLCDGILDRLLPEHAEDDVALVAVRLRGTGAHEPSAR